MISGESHYFLGRRYRLRVVEHNFPAKVILPAADTKARERVLQRWYRERLRELISPLLSKWEAALGLCAAECSIKKMKTKWGACNIEARRIWLNLELVKKPPKCVEYLIVNELTHFLERHHNDRFISLMDGHLPDWRLRAG